MSSVSSAKTAGYIDTEKLTKGFSTVINKQEAEYQKQIDTLKAHPDDQAAALEAQRIRGNIDRLVSMISNLLESIHKNCMEIIKKLNVA